jgi:uncharacterized membrane protein
VVRIRQLVDGLSHRLLFVPILAMVVAIVLSQLAILVDGNVATGELPQFLQTTIPNSRSILAAIAGGLISAITLLLSLMMVTVQLASSQFSPRALRNWVGDRTLQVVIGMLLGTTVYCLLILRQTRTFTDVQAVTPNISVILGVVLGILSLVAMVVAVDHMTNSLRVGSVATRLRSATVRLVDHGDAGGDLTGTGAGSMSGSTQDRSPPSTAFVVESAGTGWLQQVSAADLREATSDGGGVWLAHPLGAFVTERSPLAWVWPAPEDEDAATCRHRVRSAVAIGDGRTMQQDIGFGILQLVDIALRALSPGVNDPNTAKDVIVHLGAVLTSIWERPTPPGRTCEGGRTVVVPVQDHRGYLHEAVDQIRRHGSGDVEVVLTLLGTLGDLRDETVRRHLPGPISPIGETIQEVLDTARARIPDARDLRRIDDLAACLRRDHDGRSRAAGRTG